MNRILDIQEYKQTESIGETALNLKQAYLYDRFGNRRVDNVNSNFPVFNSPFNVDQTTNRLLAPNGTISYDAVGNQTNDGYSGAGSRTYDANNKLVSATTSSGTASYAYDANGNRISKTVNGVTTWNIYGFGDELVAEYPVNGAVGSPQKEYGYRGDQMLVVYDSTETGNKQLQWLVQDLLGSTRMVVDLSGSLTGMKRHDFLPFGEEIGAGVGVRTVPQGYPPPDDKIRQKFTSKERDSETGLDYFLARYFSPVQGRFINPDEFSGGPDELFDFANQASENPTFYADIYNPQSLNKYQYAYNNPLRYTDDDGHEATGTTPDPNCCPQAIPAPVPAPVIPVVPVTPEQGQQVIDQINKGINKLGDQYDKVPYLRQIRRDIRVTENPVINVPAPPLTLPGVPNIPGAPGYTGDQAQPQARPVPVNMPRPIDDPNEQGHKSNKRKHDKHTKPRPGDKKPPNYRPFRKPPKKPPKPPKPPMENKGPKKK